MIIEMYDSMIDVFFYLCTMSFENLIKNSGMPGDHMRIHEANKKSGALL